MAAKGASRGPAQEAGSRRWARSGVPCRALALCLTAVCLAAAAAQQGGPCKFLPGVNPGGPACTMNSWILACLVVCFVGAWTPAVHTQVAGVSEDCCLAYHRLPWAVLQRTRGYQLQEVSGSCNLPAVRFCLKHRIVCGNPQDKVVQRAMQFLNTQRKSCHHSQMTLQRGSHTGKKKLSSRKSWPPSSKQSSPAGSSKRNATLQTAAKLGL